MTTQFAFFVGLTGVALALAVLSRLPRFPRAAPRRMTLPEDDSGSAAMEMILVLPMFLTTIMVVVQCTHLMFAAILVEHAAFCVSRGAAVQIPLSLEGEPENQLWASDRSPKLTRLNASANLLLAPLQRRFSVPFTPGFDLSPSEYLASDFVPDPGELFGVKTVVGDIYIRAYGNAFARNQFNLPYLKWLLNLGVPRVEIRRGGESQTGEYKDEARRFEDSEVIDVRVVYEYPLDVPAGGNILGPLIGYLPDFGPDWLSRYASLLAGFKYRTDISSTYRVVNWGQPEAPATP